MNDADQAGKQTPLSFELERNTGAHFEEGKRLLRILWGQKPHIPLQSENRERCVYRPDDCASGPRAGELLG